MDNASIDLTAKAEVSQSNSDATFAERRKYPRKSVQIKAQLHARGRTQDTVINDLSAGGVGLNGAVGIYPDDTVGIELSDGRRLHGTVAWWLTGCCGVKFDEPLEHDDLLLADD